MNMNRAKAQYTPTFDLDGFREIVGDQAIGRLQRWGGRFQRAFQNGRGGTSIWHINSSAAGGGVADILNSLVPLATELGVSTQWLVIGGDKKFFTITKAFHNALQGSSDIEITDEMIAHYHRVTAANAEVLNRLIEEKQWSAPDVVILHDPQPAGLISHWRARFPETIFIWRGHIQFDIAAWGPSHPGRRVWQMLVRFVNQCDGAVFHLPEQVPPGIEVPVRFILPSINPLAPINRDLTTPAAAQFIHSTLSKYGLEDLQDPSVPVILQNARFDPWKDPLGVIEAFREAQELVPLSCKCKQPRLLLVGPLAADDPEAHGVLAQLGQVVNGDGTVRILPLIPNDCEVTIRQAEALEAIGVDPRKLRSEDLLEFEINVFQTRADIIVAKSLREGFGLTVTGAGYHAKPRIVSQVGGLTTQVIGRRGTVYGCLVGGSPEFSRETSIEMTRDWIVKLLCSARLRKTLGTKAKRHVIRHFLPHRHLQDYFELFLDLQQHRKSQNGTAGTKRYPSVEVSL